MTVTAYKPPSGPIASDEYPFPAALLPKFTLVKEIFDGPPPETVPVVKLELNGMTAAPVVSFTSAVMTKVYCVLA